MGVLNSLSRFENLIIKRPFLPYKIMIFTSYELVVACAAGVFEHFCVLRGMLGAGVGQSSDSASCLRCLGGKESQGSVMSRSELLTPQVLDRRVTLANLRVFLSFNFLLLKMI